MPRGSYIGLWPLFPLSLYIGFDCRWFSLFRAGGLEGRSARFDPLEFGGLNGRLPSLDFDERSAALGGVNGRFDRGFALLEFAGVMGRLSAFAGPRASRGDMAGA